MGRSNTLIFLEKMECWNGLQATDILYVRTEDGDLGLASSCVSNFSHANPRHFPDCRQYSLGAAI